MNAELCGRAGRVVVLVAAVVMGSGAHAQTNASSSAKEYNKKAIQAFKKGDCKGALENFERAFELNPDAKIRLNLGVTNECLDRFDEARGHYDAFLREHPKSEKAGVVRDKLKAVEKKMQQWGKVVVTVQPRADSVELADRKYTDDVKAWLPPGTHKLKVMREGYETATQDVEIKPGVRFEVRVALKAAAKEPAVASADKKASTTDKPADTKTAPATTTDKPAAGDKGTETSTGTQVAAATPAEGSGSTTSTDPVATNTATGTAPADASKGGETTAAPAPEEQGGGSAAPMLLRGVGAVGMGLAGAAVLVGVLGAAASGGLLGTYMFAPVSLIPGGLDRNRDAFSVGITAGAVVAALGLVTLPVWALLAAATFGASFVL